MTPEVTGENKKEMEPQKPKVVVKRCIDFRTTNGITTYLEEQHHLKTGDYYLEATAGASINPTKNSIDIDKFINIDHETCGRYTAVGDDSDSIHTTNMQIQGKILLDTNPKLDYQTHLLPVKDTRHTCAAVAIILGKPEIVKQAFAEIERLGLTNNCDIISRPDKLSADDNSIWKESDDITQEGDLPLSLSLHKPKKILIFDDNETNARMLVEKATTVAQGIEIEPKVFSQAA